MKICFVSPGYRVVHVLKGDTTNSGGAEAQIAYIGRDLASIGAKVELIYGGGPHVESPTSLAGIQCVDAFPSWRRPASLLRFFAALRASRADYFYANLPDDFLFITAFARFLQPRSKFIFAIANDVHCNPWRTYRYRSWFHNPLFALGLYSADAITLQHEAQRAAVRPHIRGQLVFVPNLLLAISEEPRPLQNAEIDVLWVAFIRPQKRLELLLDLAEQLGHVRFAVLGGFDAQTLSDDQLRMLQGRMKNLHNVAYHGPCTHEQVLAFLSKCKVLVSTSLFEGFPNTMLEAWGVGVPVLSLGVDPGGIIRREQVGLVSQTLPALAADLDRILSDPGLNEELGLRGLAYVRRWHASKALYECLDEIMPGISKLYDNARSAQ